MLEVIEPGPYTTAQDDGRFHLSHFGISAGGAADPVSWQLANLLVGNRTTRALEMTLRGGTFRFITDKAFALAGADCGALLDDKAVAAWETVLAKSGQVLKLGNCLEGARAYLAVAGGILAVGQLVKGARLKLGPDSKVKRLKTAYRIRKASDLRVLKGVDWQKFPESLRSAFFEGSFEVTPQSNRNGLRLKGQLALAHVPGERLTEGVLWGTVQVPPSGEPLILMNDQQTTGGYPQLAQVIQADRCVLGQLRPGDPIRFRCVEVDEAVDILREQSRVVETNVVPL